MKTTPHYSCTTHQDWLFAVAKSKLEASGWVSCGLFKAVSLQQKVFQLKLTAKYHRL